MSISFYSEDRKVKRFNQKQIRNWVKFVISNELHKPGNINFIFCSDDYLLDVNKQFLNHDYYTDVITFDYVEGKNVAGDVFISIDRVQENAQLFGNDFFTELQRVMIHGVLHLLGYDDKDESSKALMTSKENEYLETVLMF